MNTGKMRTAYTYWQSTFTDYSNADAHEQFDRWYAEEIRKAKEEAWDEGYELGWNDAGGES